MPMPEDISSMEEFETHISQASAAVALFYYPYCPFCSYFMPEFERQAGEKPGFFRLRADILEEIEDRHGVEVVPTVIVFRDGKESARLDGKHGRGLSAAQLKDFLAGQGF